MGSESILLRKQKLRTKIRSSLRSIGRVVEIVVDRQIYVPVGATGSNGLSFLNTVPTFATSILIDKCHLKHDTAESVAV